MNELIEFSLDVEDGQKNYALANWYEQQNHTAAAHTYYLRASERSQDKVLAYKALIRASFCYSKQGSREGTEKVLIENALIVCPERPEAYYFLSLIYERRGDWQNCYIYASLGLECYGKEIESLGISEYSGKQLLMFQKAVAAWYWGKGNESRNLFQELASKYYNLMEDKHKILIDENMKKFGLKINKTIVDCFRFFNEKELLELRYHVLKDYVDRFIILEGTRTQSGHLRDELLAKKYIKELNLPEEKFIVIEMDLPGNDEDIENTADDIAFRSLSGQSSDTYKNSLNARTRERLLLNSLLDVVDEFDDNTVFLVSDCDEIIKPENIPYFSDTVLKNQGHLIKVPLIELQGKANLRAYDVNTDIPISTDKVFFMCTHSHLRKATPFQMRFDINNPFQTVYITQDGKRLEECGWHFSWMGDNNRLKLKQKSTSHYADKIDGAIHKDMNSKELEEFIDQWKPSVGGINPWGYKGYVLKEYSTENLPKQFFEYDHLRKFFLMDINYNNNKYEVKSKTSSEQETLENNYYIIKDSNDCDVSFTIEENVKHNYSSLIRESLKYAKDGESSLPEWILNMEGMSGKKYRNFINKLISLIPDPRYLEIGCWTGSTAVSAMYSNNVDATLIDNFSEEFGDYKQRFFSNLEKCKAKNVTFINKNFENVKYAADKKYNIYFYDGPHDEQNQCNALTIPYDSLDDEFIFICDDWCWDPAVIGTLKGIEKLNLEVLYSIQIKTTNYLTGHDNQNTCENSDWHNGYYIAVCKKPKNNETNVPRSRIINSLIKKIGAKKYLEIGVAGGENLSTIECEYKIGVDPNVNSPATFHLTSDKFFEQNQETFDVIFIDGLHHADQVYKDILNSLDVLNDGGYIVCHDMNPEKEEYQIIPLREGVVTWNGDCWKAFVRLRRERENLEMFVVNTDHGCGIIRKGKQTKIDIKEEITYKNFDKHRKEWLNLIEVQDFFKSLEVKNKIPVLGVPIVNGVHWLRRLIDSIDYPVEELFIVNNNGRDQIITELDELTKINHPFIEKIRVCHLPHNLGVAGAWNLIIKSYLMSPYWIICNNDVAFTPGFLKEMVEKASDSDTEIVWPPSINKYYVANGLGSFECFLLKPSVIEKCGLFDENLYPAYCEDCDYLVKIKSKDISSKYVTASYYHGESQHYETGSQTLKLESPEVSNKIRQSHMLNIQYMKDTWGSDWENWEKYSNELPTFNRNYDIELVKQKYLGF